MSRTLSRPSSRFPSYVVERTKTENWNYEITDEDADGELYASDEEMREREEVQEGCGELDEEREAVNGIPLPSRPFVARRLTYRVLLPSLRPTHSQTHARPSRPFPLSRTKSNSLLSLPQAIIPLAQLPVASPSKSSAEVNQPQIPPSIPTSPTKRTLEEAEIENESVEHASELNEGSTSQEADVDVFSPAMKPRIRTRVRQRTAVSPPASHLDSRAHSIRDDIPQSPPVSVIRYLASAPHPAAYNAVASSSKPSAAVDTSTFRFLTSSSSPPPRNALASSSRLRMNAAPGSPSAASVITHAIASSPRTFSQTSHIQLVSRPQQPVQLFSSSPLSGLISPTKGELKAAEVEGEDGDEFCSLSELSSTEGDEDKDAADAEAGDEPASDSNETAAASRKKKAVASKSKSKGKAVASGERAFDPKGRGPKQTNEKKTVVVVGVGERIKKRRQESSSKEKGKGKGKKRARESSDEEEDEYSLESEERESEEEVEMLKRRKIVTGQGSGSGKGGKKKGGKTNRRSQYPPPAPPIASLPSSSNHASSSTSIKPRTKLSTKIQSLNSIYTPSEDSSLILSLIDSLGAIPWGTVLEKHEARGFKGRSKGGVKARWRKTLKGVYEELVEGGRGEGE